MTPLLLSRQFLLAVRCCPHLQQLVARGCPQPDVDWSVLNQLPELRCLAANHISDAAAAKIAQLMTLDWLMIGTPSSISIAGVQLFTALKMLTHLMVYEDEDLDLMAHHYIHQRVNQRWAATGAGTPDWVTQASRVTRSDWPAGCVWRAASTCLTPVSHHITHGIAAALLPSACSGSLKHAKRVAADQARHRRHVRR